MFRLVIAFVLVASPALAYDPTPGDGAYGALGENGPGGNFGTRLSINLQRVGQLVELKANADTGLNCTYFADLSTGFVRAIEGQCFEINAVSLSESDDGIVFSAPDLWPDPMPLSAYNTVLDDMERTRPQSGFDVLGLTVGMTRTEIEAALAERDWTVFEEFYRERTPEWGHWTVIYTAAGSEEGRARDLPDAIRVEYGGASDAFATGGMDMPSNQVRREVNYKRAESPPEVIVIDQALRDKYGIDGGVDDLGVGTSQDRFFDASGALVVDRLEKVMPGCRNYEKPAQSHKPENAAPCVFELSVGKTVRRSSVERMVVSVTDRFASQQETVKQTLARTQQKLTRISKALQGEGTAGGAQTPEL